jgi:hypothetical protein
MAPVGYSIFTNGAIEHHGKLYQAEADEFPGALEFDLSLIKGEQPELPVPVVLVRLPIRQPPIDFVPIVNLHANVCSQRFIDTLTHLNVPFVTYPSAVVAADSGQPVPDSYIVWKPVPWESAIDWERSKYEYHPLRKRPTVSELVLTEACLLANPPLFHDSTYSEWLIRNDIGEHLADDSLTGFVFYPLTLPLYQRALPGKEYAAGYPRPITLG